MTYRLMCLSLFATTQSLSLPAAPQLQSCSWLDDTLTVAWDDTAGSDYFELQLLRPSENHSFAVFATKHSRAKLDMLLPNTVYQFRVRAHSDKASSLGPGTWGPVGEAFECSTGEHQNPQGSEGISSSSKPQGHKTLFLETMRQSEFTYDVDYLMNHNSGTVLGDAAFITFTTSDPAQPTFINESFQNGTFSVYCLEILNVTLPNSRTTGGNLSFADYVSCNDGGDPSHPDCECDNWIDRTIANMNTTGVCSLPDGSDCSRKTDDCTCRCSKQSLVDSAKYTGMMPVYFWQAQQLGSWFSHPAATECKEGEEVGDFQSDGTRCTWKHGSLVRVLHGWQLLANGWSVQKKASGPLVHDAYHNVKVVQRTIDSAPLRPWTCGGSNSFESLDQTLLNSVIV